MKDSQIVKYLADNWEKCGVEQRDVLLVHSSLKRLLLKVSHEFGVRISIKTVYNSFLEVLGEKGTLILPLFNFDFPKTKFFDICNTPSQMGSLTEIGRLDESSVRTGHPIYSFSIFGYHKKEFININNYSGYGPDSPFAVIKALDGKIAIIGLTDQHSMTSYHFVEEANNVDYRYYKEFEGKYIDRDGEKTHRKYALYVRNLAENVQTDVNRMMNYLWLNGFYKGEKHDEGYGMRTIKFRDLYQQTEIIIKKGEAINYLYSIKKD